MPTPSPPACRNSTDNPIRLVTNSDELAAALDYPWDKWTIFVHPSQRELVTRDCNGPARVAGSADTGKTIARCTGRCIWRAAVFCTINRLMRSGRGVSTFNPDHSMNIDPQLLHDCHVLGVLERATVLLNRNASVGWLILVPETEAVDWHELDDAEHEQISGQIRDLARFTARWFAADKLNVATLGNQVAQMHVHVIARHHNDPCWPRPVWGHLDVQRDYPATEIDNVRRALVDQLELVAGGSS